MEQSATDFNLKEWGLKARITRENTNFRRFSSSNLKSFREDSTTTISSTVSSPGYTIREEIDPSTYSFTAAIKALQAKSVCSWENRLTLHSKWSDAEKYISNPLSGEVPLECLSAKTLSSRSFSSLTNRITVSHDLQHFHPIIQHHYQQHKLNITIQEKKKKCTSMTRDVGIQSTPQGDLSSSSPSSPIQPTTPSIEERRRKVSVGESGDSSSPSSTEKEKPETVEEVEERETKKEKELGRGRMMKGGGRRGYRCLSIFKGLCLWQREKYYCNCKPRIKNINDNPNPKSSPKFRFQVNSCYEL